MVPSHSLGCVDVSKPLRNECQWQSDSHSVGERGDSKFASSMYKHTPMPPFCFSIAKAAAFSKTVETACLQGTVMYPTQLGR